MSVLADPALFRTLLIVFVVSAVGFLVLWQAERRRMLRRMEAVVEASRAAGPPAGTEDGDGQEGPEDAAQALRARRRPLSPLTGALHGFLAAGGYRGTLADYLKARVALALALGAGLWLLNPLGWVNLAIGALLVLAGSYVVGLRAIRKRARIMEAEFPAALDIMVRGIRTGMPLIDSMRVVATEAHPVLAREFQVLIDELALGVRFTDAMHRMVPRVPIPDIEFFAVVMGLQADAGGAVADTLDAAAETMRSRRELRDKVATMSAEARTSAMIIGALPILVSAVMAYTSPEYIGLLLTTGLGNLFALGAVAWALIGIFIMRAMIDFEL